MNPIGDFSIWGDDFNSIANCWEEEEEVDDFDADVRDVFNAVVDCWEEEVAGEHNVFNSIAESWEEEVDGFDADVRDVFNAVVDGFVSDLDDDERST